MKITEKHLQDIFDEIEADAAIKGVKNPDEEHGMMLAALKMQNLLRLVLKVNSEEELKLSREHSKELVRMMELGNGDIYAVIYDCGHVIDPVIINTNEFTLATYMEWREAKSGLCIRCWLKKMR